MGGVKKIIAQLGKRGARSEEEKERLMYSLVTINSAITEKSFICLQ